jgi:hypothetical protein
MRRRKREAQTASRRSSRRPRKTRTDIVRSGPFGPKNGRALIRPTSELYADVDAHMDQLVLLSAWA